MPDIIDPIPSTGLLLHIGPQKTGSTAIQHALNDNREELARYGVRYAGKHYRPRWAGWAILGYAPQGRPVPPLRHWHKLAADCREHDDVRICLSNEDLAKASQSRADLVVSSLDPERVHLLFVVRPLVSLLPSQWQEVVKARATESYDDWLRLVLTDESTGAQWRNLWEPQDVGAIVKRWSRLLPEGRVTLLCLDGRDRELAPRTFEQLLGLPEHLLDPDPERSNQSLTFEQIELLRAVNAVAVDDGWSGEEYWRTVQQGVVLRGLLNHEPSPTSTRIPPLPEWSLPLVERYAQRQYDAVVDSGARVIGNPKMLLRMPEELRAETVPDVAQVDMLDAAAAVVGAMRGGQILREKEFERAVELGRSGATPDQFGGRQLARALATKIRRRVAR